MTESYRVDFHESSLEFQPAKLPDLGGGRCCISSGIVKADDDSHGDGATKLAPLSIPSRLQKSTYGVNSLEV